MRWNNTTKEAEICLPEKAHHCLIEKKLYYFYSSIRHIGTIDR